MMRLAAAFLVLPLVGCASADPTVAGATRADSCTILPASRAASLLDERYLRDRSERWRQRETLDGAAGGSPYEFDDNPLGGDTPLAGACDCLAQKLPLGGSFDCPTVGEAAHVCLGSDGSERLWANQRCVPYEVEVDGSRTSIGFTYGGCIIPDGGFLFLESPAAED